MTNYQSIKLRLAVGFAGLFIGRLLYNFGGETAFLGYPLILLAMPVFIWGCWDFAKGKGYPGYIGLLGVLSLIGLIILYALPDKKFEGAYPTDADDIDGL